MCYDAQCQDLILRVLLLDRQPDRQTSRQMDGQIKILIDIDRKIDEHR
jgi:hypothetical protein